MIYHITLQVKQLRKFAFSSALKRMSAVVLVANTRVRVSARQVWFRAFDSFFNISTTSLHSAHPQNSPVYERWVVSKGAPEVLQPMLKDCPDWSRTCMGGMDV